MNRFYNRKVSAGSPNIADSKGCKNIPDVKLDRWNRHTVTRNIKKFICSKLKSKDFLQVINFLYIQLYDELMYLDFRGISILEYLNLRLKIYQILCAWKLHESHSLYNVLVSVPDVIFWKKAQLLHFSPRRLDKMFRLVNIEAYVRVLAFRILHKK